MHVFDLLQLQFGPKACRQANQWKVVRDGIELWFIKAVDERNPDYKVRTRTSTFSGEVLKNSFYSSLAGEQGNIRNILRGIDL